MGKMTGGGRSRNASPSSSEGNENFSQSTKVRTGRCQGSKNFAEDEVTALVALVLTNWRNWVYAFVSEEGNLVNHGVFVQARLVASALTTSSQSRSLQYLQSFLRLSETLSTSMSLLKLLLTTSRRIWSLKACRRS
jgi:hypothetical protein